MSCTCLNIASIISEQISSLISAYTTLRQNSNLPATDSGYLPQGTPSNTVSPDTSFDDNLNFAFYVLMAIISLIFIGGMLSSSRRRKLSSKLN